MVWFLARNWFPFVRRLAIVAVIVWLCCGGYTWIMLKLQDGVLSSMKNRPASAGAGVVGSAMGAGSSAVMGGAAREKKKGPRVLDLVAGGYTWREADGLSKEELLAVCARVGPVFAGLDDKVRSQRAEVVMMRRKMAEWSCLCWCVRRGCN